MLRRIGQAWQNVGLAVTPLEDRCVPATGMAFDVPTVIQVSPVANAVRIDAPVPSMPEPAKVSIRTDLFCSGMPSSDDWSLAEESVWDEEAAASVPRETENES